MATPFHLPVTAAQVGTYFVGNYYQVLQSQPDFVHQFYSDRSTLLRVDGHNRDTAASMLPIHHHHHPVAYMNPTDLVSNLNASTAIREQASSYISDGDTTVVENGTVNSYSFQEQQLQASGAESVLENGYVGQTNGSVQNSVNALQDKTVVEVVGEPQKHTYASILQVAKGRSAPSAPREQPVTKSTVSSELNHRPEPSGQQTVAASTEAMDDTTAFDDEAEVKSIYVKNVPSTANVSDIEEEFKKFGKIRQDGSAIRTRKDLDVCYAFVEFEDITSIHNAIKASTVEICGQQVYIEGRRANRSNTYRGGRGRGRFGGRNYSNSSRGDRHDNNGYTRLRGNGYYRRQNRAYSNPHQVSKNGHE